jgi:predicted  nucleic acid-binding Zn-ribbon protein
MAHDTDFTTEILQRLARIESKQDSINEKIAGITDGCKECEKEQDKLKDDLSALKTQHAAEIAELKTTIKTWAAALGIGITLLSIIIGVVLHFV